MSKFNEQAVADIRRQDPQNFVTASKSLGVEDQIVYITTSAAAVTITMPPVKEAQGRIYSIYFTSKTTYDVTISDKAGDTPAGDLGAGDITLDATNEYSVLFSDGRNWLEIGENHA